VLERNDGFTFGGIIKMIFINKYAQTMISFIGMKFVLRNGALG
jgi:hypothetical protein